jgi:membrane associated rhomboid family serine protease
MRGVIGKGIVRRGGPIAAHSMGPYFLDFAHQPYPLSSYQKHRYLSSGFLHGSLLHLGMNLRALLSIPLWLENGIGKGVYLSAYLAAIVTGNIAQTLFTIGDLSGRSSSSLCIGASGGICGLYGLMLSSLLKMGNADAAYYVLKNMAWLLLFGYLVPNVSHAGHAGGFVGGVLVGYLFGPGYERSYSLNRADGFARDKADPEFRQMMGPGIYPSMEKAIFPLKYLWMCVGLAIIARPDLRLIPIALVRGILEPGSLSGARVLLRNA